MRFSFVCPVNNQKSFEENTGSFFKIQNNRDFETIIVDTQKNKFSSAAAALNYGGSRATGDYIVFLHQDIRIEDGNFLDELAALVAEKDFLIAGVAGVIPGETRYRFYLQSNIASGPNKIIGNRQKEIDSCVQVDTLDECFFIIPRAVFQKRQFVEYYPSWHLYAVEYSLWANQTVPGSVIVLPIFLWHRSEGVSIDQSYFKTLKKIQAHYKMDIRTSMGAWPKGIVIRSMVFWVAKRNFRKKFKKQL